MARFCVRENGAKTSIDFDRSIPVIPTPLFGTLWHPHARRPGPPVTTPGGQQQHRELQRTLQRTWSPTERYSASRVVPVARRHSEGVRCSGAEQLLVRGHRIAPFARGRPSLEKRERGPRRPSKARDREMGVQRGTLAMRATRKYDHMVMPVPNGVQLH